MRRGLVVAVLVLLGSMIGSALPGAAAQAAVVPVAAPAESATGSPSASAREARSDLKKATKHAKKWYRAVNKRQWKRVRKLSMPGVVKGIKNEIKFVREYHEVNLTFGKKASCELVSDGMVDGAPYYSCYSNRSDPVEIGIRKYDGRWRVIGHQLYD